MAARPSLDDLPPELLEEILSRLSWRQQLTVRRVSRRWQQASDACLARRRELHISEADVKKLSINTGRLLNALQAMPALRRLCLASCPRYWQQRREDAKMEVYRFLCSGTISAAQNLNRRKGCFMDIALYLPSVERLCDSCPQLQEVSLHCLVGESGVETLLRRLPQLRSLHLTAVPEDESRLSLLPGRLQALSLSRRTGPDLSGLRETVRYPQLRELHLLEGSVRREQFVAMLVACPGLERLSVAYCHGQTLEWLPQLTHCPQLRELDISLDCMEPALPVAGLCVLSSILTACGRLERLRLNFCLNPVSVSPTISPHGLTHLDISNTRTNSETLRRLAGLLPGLRDLRLHGCSRLTNDGLARGLPRFTVLQVLDLTDVYALSRSNDDIVSLIGSHLKMFAYGNTFEADFFKVARVLGHFRTLAVLRLKSHKFDVAAGFSLFVDELAGSDREITLLLSPAAIRDLPAHLPGNLRVLEDSEDVWDELTDWRRPGVCGCDTEK